MENKMFLIREMYDSMSYNFHNELCGFIEEENSLLVGCRRCGKTTIAIIDALSEALTTDGIRIGFYTDNGTNRLKVDLIKNTCEIFGIDYSIDIMNHSIILSNGSVIQAINKDQTRGRRYDYVIADVCVLTEFDYRDICHISLGRYRLIINSQNSFTYKYKNDNPDKVFSLVWNNLVSGEWW